MYFAIDPALPDLQNQIVQSLTGLYKDCVDASPYVFALIDGVFDEQLLARRGWSRQTKYSLYEGTDLEEFGAAAPHLLEAPVEIDERERWLREIISACEGKPMLSFLASVLSAPELCLHFRPYLIARSEDLTEWPLRWADTRVLPEILAVIKPEYCEQLMSPLHAWWSIRRDGSLVVWKGTTASQRSPVGFDKIPLSDREFSELVDRAEADAVLANIHDTHTDLLRRYTPSECHARVAEHLLVASEHGIHAASARQHFSMLALSLNESFARHPAMATLLQRTQQGGDYASGIGTLPDAFWQETG